MTNTLKDKAIGALVGLAAGDAVGTTVEFRTRDSFDPVTDMVGGGPFHLSPGQWTDDTSMALCLADSLLFADEFDARDLMERFCQWHLDGRNASNGTCFDIGIATRMALQDYLDSGNPWAGDPAIRSSGNGSLMRVSPVAIRWHDQPDEAAKRAREQSCTTHASPLCLEACDVFSRMLCAAMHGADKAEIVSKISGLSHANFARFTQPDWIEKRRDEIKSSGYVVDTLEAALWAFWHSETFEEAVLLAANLGDDADTVAAVTGQIAGAYWGYNAIPAGWRAKLTWEADICRRAEALFDKK
ncbi:ADP-ribosylglycohydrolase family protein [Asticcacaulis sp. AC402]|uniref:ADP-ribosylglycohydrolase family protein n=1 Tax=Asticcacaulis sp. AC402 TaxID=1282361 RepID=UPI0003C3E825|nr:ADP-ribosylglycohydrolase family protein [Asticcacaulis sp. AC402]ESQ76430.1 hypothetical protein ABAC402_04840 [Asticcacaulis sp. AC402]